MVAVSSFSQDVRLPTSSVLIFCVSSLPFAEFKLEKDDLNGFSGVCSLLRVRGTGCVRIRRNSVDPGSRDSELERHIEATSESA